jgi:hypothetical protein
VTLSFLLLINWWKVDWQWASFHKDKRFSLLDAVIHHPNNIERKVFLLEWRSVDVWVHAS